MSQANVNIIRSFYDAFDSGEDDSIIALLGEDVVAEVADGLPWSGTYHGPEGFRVMLEKLHDHVTVSFETDQLIDADDDVAQSGRTVGNVLVSGRHFDLPEIHIWELREGKIVSFRNYSDSAERRRVLGLE